VAKYLKGKNLSNIKLHVNNGIMKFIFSNRKHETTSDKYTLSKHFNYKYQIKILSEEGNDEDFT
jgi:hypothetical protein